MTYNRSLVIGLVFVLGSLVLSAWLYPHLPETMPQRWDAAGNVVAYGPRSQLVFLMPAIIAFTWVLLIVLPRLSPHGFRIDPFLDVFGVVLAGIIAVLAFLHTITLLDAAGHALPIVGTMFVAIGLLMLSLGTIWAN